jgi:hypothetical protein
MDKLIERIETLKNVEKLLKEGGDNDPMKTWNSMGLFNPWYVLNEKNNIIKFSWREAFSMENVCVVIKWDKFYKNCKLLYSDTRLYNDYIKNMELHKKDIIRLEKYLYENDYFNYKNINDCIQLDGSHSELEVRINNQYNAEDDISCLDNHIIYNFAIILFKLAKEEPGNILGS